MEKKLGAVSGEVEIVRVMAAAWLISVMVSAVCILLLLHLVRCIQYKEIAYAIDPIDLSWNTMTESIVTFTDDVPFERIALPVRRSPNE